METLTNKTTLTAYFDFSFTQKKNALKYARVEFKSEEQKEYLYKSLKLVYNQAQKLFFAGLKKESEQFVKEFDKLILKNKLQISYTE